MRTRSILISVTAALVGASIGSATLSAAAPPSPSPTQVIGQLEVAGVQGDSVRDGFEDSVEIRSFDFSAGKSGAKDPVYRRFEVAAAIDSASIGLLDRLSLGATIPTVKLSLRDASSEGIATFKSFTLSNAKVAALREFASGQGSDVAMIEVAFAYKTISVEWHRGLNTGGFCWSLVSASEC